MYGVLRMHLSNDTLVRTSGHFSQVPPFVFDSTCVIMLVAQQELYQE